MHDIPDFTKPRSIFTSASSPCIHASHCPSSGEIRRLERSATRWRVASLSTRSARQGRTRYLAPAHRGLDLAAQLDAAKTDHDHFLTSRAARRCSRTRVHRTQLLGALTEDSQLAIAECLDVRDSMAHLFWLISIIWLILRHILSHPA